MLRNSMIFSTWLFALTSIAIAGDRYYEDAREPIKIHGEDGKESVEKNERITLIGKYLERRRDWISKRIKWKEPVCTAVRDPKDLRKNWKGFYEARYQSDRNRALAAAITGITAAQAELITANGYFDQAPPRTFEEFKSQIALIEEKFKVYGIYETIIVQNGLENAKNLGYDSKSTDTPPAQETPQTEDPWFNFWRLQNPEKRIAALARALEGISNDDAKMLLYSDWQSQTPKAKRSDYFVKKPATWEDLKTELKKFDTQYSTRMFQKIIAENGSQNKSRLYPDVPPKNPGNGNNSGGTSNQSTCKIESKEGLRWVLGEEANIELNRYTRELNISVSKSILLPWEEEEIFFKYTPADDKVSIDAETKTFNNYKIEQDGRNIVRISGIGRKQTIPSADEFRVTFERAGAAFVLKIDDTKADQIGRVSRDLKWKVSYTLVGLEGKFCKDEKNLDSKSLDMTSNNQEFTIGDSLSLTTGQNYYLKDLRIERLNTPYFKGGTSLSNTRSTKY